MEVALALTLALSLYNFPSYELDHAIQLHRQYDFETSLSKLEKLTKLSEADNVRRHFYKLVNHFYLNQKSKTLKQAEYIENFLVEIPERYKVTTFLIHEEAKLWESDDLGDISREMRVSKGRLDNGLLGKDTEKLQKDIVAKLDKLIEEKENPPKGDGDADSQGNPQQPKHVTKPLDESKIVGSEGKGDVDNRKFRVLSEKWNSLPPQAQVRALQEVTQGMSHRHKEAIENYFRLLSSSQPKR